MKKVFVVIMFLVLVMVLAAPAGATPSEEVTITVNSEYTYWPAYNSTGTWDSSGAIASSGDFLGVQKHFGAGSPPGKPFQTAHVIEVIGDDLGTLSISAQFKKIEFSYTEPCGVALCQHYKGIGSWVILSGTGAYTNAHGHGTAKVNGDAFIIEVGDDLYIEGQDIETVYAGSIHFDPN